MSVFVLLSTYKWHLFTCFFQPTKISAIYKISIESENAVAIPKFYILMGWDRGWVMAFPFVSSLFWRVDYDRPSLNPFCFSENFLLLVYCEVVKYDDILLSSCARAGEPVSCQCHSSAAARWAMYVHEICHTRHESAQSYINWPHTQGNNVSVKLSLTG